MHHLYLLLRIYPYWAIPVAFILAEVGLFLRRRRNPAGFLFWGLVLLLMTGVVLWFVYRGDLNSDKWIRVLH